MLVLAVFTVIAGERLARREVEERIPVDRDRLLDLSATLETELNRLDSLYLGHLDHLVVGYASTAVAGLPSPGTRSFLAPVPCASSRSLRCAVPRSGAGQGICLARLFWVGGCSFEDLSRLSL